MIIYTHPVRESFVLHFCPMWKSDFTFTKRLLGWAAILGGVLGLAAILFYDQIGLSDPNGGFGPSQTFALIGAIAAVGVGLTLLPLGDDPA